MSMKVSFDLFSGFTDSRVQRLVEEEQTALVCGLLAQAIESFIKDEQDSLNEELANYAAADDWPKFAPARLLNLIALYHLRQGLAALSRGTDFSELSSVLDSLPGDLIMEFIEGLLSAFQEQLNIFTLTSDDVKQAFAKYGTRSETGGSISIGSDMTKDAFERIRAQMPRYINYPDC